MRPPGYGYDRELLSGLFVILGIFVIGIFSMKITDSPIFRPGTEFTVYLDDATGIFRNSKVKIAGINVGVVRSIDLKEGKAKVSILLDRGYKIEKGSYVLPRAQGILGDRFLEIVLPRNDLEADGYQKAGAQEPQGTDHSNHSSDSSTERKPSENSTSSGSTTSYLEFILKYILPVAHAEEDYREGEIIPAKPGTATTDDVMRKLGDIGDDVKVLAKDLKEIIHSNKGDIQDAIKAIRRSADNLDLILRDLSEKNTRTDLKESIKGLRESVENIKSITNKVDKGEGSIGKLINDPQAADQLVRALNSIVEYLDKAKRMEFIVDMNSNYQFGIKKTKTYFDLNILPRSYYGYIFGIVQDPGGRETKTTTYVSTNGGPPVRTDVTNYDKSAFKFNVQFIRKISLATFRLGLFETTGGAALDLELWKGHFFLTTEAFDFGRDNDNAHVRSYGKLMFLDSIYLQGGCDDLASRNSRTRSNSMFAGLGLQFNDNDLKSFLVLLAGAP